MIYKTFIAESVISALTAIDEIIENFDDRYSHFFEDCNIHAVRLILESDYDCPEGIVEEAVSVAASNGSFKYEPNILELI